jgi:hypothetical protein
MVSGIGYLQVKIILLWYGNQRKLNSMMGYSLKTSIPLV